MCEYVSSCIHVECTGGEVHTTCLVLGESNFCVSVIKTLQKLLFHEWATHILWMDGSCIDIYLSHRFVPS